MDLGKYTPLALSALYLLTWLDAILPLPAVGSRWERPRAILHLVAANVWKARNALEHKEDERVA